MIVVALLVFAALLFVLLPIRICGSGRYEDGAATCWGWVRPWGGLVGVRVGYEGGQLRAGLMLLAWVPFSVALRRGNKEEHGADGPRGGADGEEAEPAEPPAGKAEQTEVATKPSLAEHGADDPKGESDEEEAEPVESSAGKAEQTEEGEKPSLAERVAKGRALVERIRLYVRKMRGPALRFLGRLLRAVRFRRVACRVVFGDPDPATTGKVYGYSLAIRNVLGEKADLEVTPDFERVRLEGRLRLEIAVFLYRLLWAVVCIGLRFAVAWLADVWTRWWRKRKTAAAPATS